jgi:hypothetical protein
VTVHLPPPERPVGDATRGTTNPNRLRRVDRWLVGTQLERLRRCTRPFVVDLGFGSDPVTTVEMFTRLREVLPETEVLGVEIDRDRVETALPQARPGLEFRRGGFNLPVLRMRPCVVRAMNVLRQYDEAEAAKAWAVLRRQLDPDGIVVEGTCDELGRRAAWVTLDTDGPQTLTFAAKTEELRVPSDLAERLPKALIHRNVTGERVHELLQTWDRTWKAASGIPNSRQRWASSVTALADAGWPVERAPNRWKLGEMTLPWSAVAPSTGP